MSNKNEEMKKKWAKLIARAWDDEKFKKRLLKETEKVLKEEGIDPGNITIKVHENKDNEVHLVIPQKPPFKLSEKDLENINAAGVNTSWVMSGVTTNAHKVNS